MLTINRIYTTVNQGQRSVERTSEHCTYGAKTAGELYATDVLLLMEHRD